MTPNLGNVSTTAVQSGGEQEPAAGPAFASTARGAIVFFLAAFVLYAATANRGMQWQDSGYHILRILGKELFNPLGLALSHPLHHFLGRLALLPGVFEPCFAITLVSSLAAAAAVAATYGGVHILTGNAYAACLSAASLALANTFWQLGTLAETYTLAAALLAGEACCLIAYGRTGRRGALWGMAFFNGLGIANHMLAALTTPVVAAIAAHSYHRKSARLGDVLLAAGLWLLGTAPYTGMIIVELVEGAGLLATLQSALFGRSYADAVLGTAVSARRALIGIGFVVLNFPNLLLPACALGAAFARRLGVPGVSRWGLLALTVIHACFVIRYNVVDHHMFFLPLYVLFCLLGGVGFALIADWSLRLRRTVFISAVALLAITPAVYALVPIVAPSLDVLKTVAHNKPYRNDYVYLFVPWSVVETSAERLSSEAVALAGRDGLILVEDRSALFAVRYKAMRFGFDGLEVSMDAPADRIRSAAAAGRTVVLIPLDADSPAFDASGGRWERVGDLYVLAAEPEE